MSFKEKYKKDINSSISTNMSFNDIKNRVVMSENKSNKKRNTIIISSLLGGALAVGASVALVIGLTGGIKNENKDILVPSDRKISFKALASAATPLVSSSITNNNQSQRLAKSLKRAVDSTKTDEEIINDLLYSFDTIIENDNNYTVEPVASDKEEYKYCEKVTFKDLLGNSNSYVLYYNEINNNKLNEDDVDDDDDSDDLDDDTNEVNENKSETESYYSGIAIQGENTLSFRLELSEETKGNEKEVESEFYLYASNDEKSYTKVISSSEIEAMESETEYGYEIVENGVLKTSYEMEIEKNAQTNKVELGLSLNEKEYEVTQVIENDETRFYVELENEQTDQEIEYVFVKVISGDTVTYQLVK